MNEKRLLGAFLDVDCKRETLVAQLAEYVRLSAHELGLRFAANNRFATKDAYNRHYAYFLALGSTLAVQTHIDTTLYAMRERNQDLAGRNIDMDVENLLYQGIGLCGSAVEVHRALLHELGIRTRRVHMSYVDAAGVRQAHIALEAFLYKRWVFLEPTWGAVFKRRGARRRSLRLLSFEELRAANGRFISIDNLLSSWRAQAEISVLPFDYLTIPEISYTLGGCGTVHVPMVPSKAGFVADFNGVQNYVGSGEESVGTDGISLSLNLPRDRAFRVRVTLAPSVGEAANDLLLNGEPMQRDRGQIYSGIAEGEIVISARTHGEICYFVISRITAEAPEAREARVAARAKPRQKSAPRRGGAVKKK